MSEDDARRWDRRYAAARPVVGPAPPDALVDPDLLPVAGRALDVACGRGVVAVWLALRGLEVRGIDVSPVAIADARRLAVEHGVAESATLDVVDLDGGLGVEHESFDVVVCQRFRDPSRYADLVDALVPGGLLVVTVLSEVGNEGEAGPFRAGPGELVDAFTGRVDVITESEADGEAHLVARRR